MVIAIDGIEIYLRGEQNLYNLPSHLWLIDCCLHLKLVVGDKNGPGKADSHQQRQDEAGIRQGEVGAPGQTLRGHLDESLLHWTDLCSEDRWRW